MGDAIFGLLTLFAFAVGLTLVLFLCHKFDLLTWLLTWAYSTREEKVGLTRLKGHFNANGYLVHSDSDIQIGHSGSFKRFDSIDKDIKIATTSFAGDWGGGGGGGGGDFDESIPPQPLRPAPVVPVPQQPRPSAPDQEEAVPRCCPKPSMTLPTLQQGKECTETSIKPLPRPVSSVNMSMLQQSNAQFITPPPAQTTGPPTASLRNGVNLNDNNHHHHHHQQHTDDTEAMPVAALKRAVSCESVCSDTSVALGDLEASNITGYLCIGLEYDADNGEMVANVLEAKELVGPNGNDEPIDSYVKIFLLPDKDVNVQTRVYRNSNSPSYQERVIFSLHPRDQMNTALLFHVYATDVSSQTLIGEGELRLSDVSLRTPVTTWVTLTDTGQRGTEFGELMFSLSYLPTAERLTVVVVKARNLRFQNDKETGDPFVKVYVLQYGKKIHKKKTSVKKGERSPIFNESMMFNIPAHTLQTIQLRLTVAETSNGDNAKAFSIGHVIIGTLASGRSLTHWNQMLSSLRKPVAMWHPLRK